MEKLHKDYHDLVKEKKKFSLDQLFRIDSYSFKENCRTYKPHAKLYYITGQAKKIGEEYGIWLKSGPYYNVSIASYIYTTGMPSRVLDISTLFVVDNFLKECWGRNAFGRLSAEEKLKATEIIQRIASQDFLIRLPDNPNSVERACFDILQTIRSKSPPQWFETFLKGWTDHIATYKNCNSNTKTIKDYSDFRRNDSGFIHIVKLIEYGFGDFLDWKWLEEMGLEESTNSLVNALENLGGLTYDFFSFEKEVIDKGAESNLLFIIALNSPDLNLLDTINLSARIIRTYLEQYFKARSKILHTLSLMSNTNSPHVAMLRRYLNALDICLQSCWSWQVATNRHKTYTDTRQHSLWMETELQLSIHPI